MNWAAFFGWFAAIIFIGVPLLFFLAFFLWMFPNPVTSPPFTTWVRVPELGAKIGLELQAISHLNEYDRQLIVKRDGQTFKTKLALDWGPADRINLHITPDGTLAVIQPVLSPVVVSFTPMREEKVPNGAIGADWRYIGAFDMVDTYPDDVSAFVIGREPRMMYVPPSAQPECNARFGNSRVIKLRLASQAPNFCPSVAYILETKSFKPYPPEKELRELRERTQRALYQYRHDQRMREGKPF